MANLHDVLGEPEQRHFMQLTGIHPRGVGVRTHRDAISYLTAIDARKRKQRAVQPAKGPGLLGLSMRAYSSNLRMTLPWLKE